MIFDEIDTLEVQEYWPSFSFRLSYELEGVRFYPKTWPVHQNLKLRQMRKVINKFNFPAA